LQHTLAAAALFSKRTRVSASHELKQKLAGISLQYCDERVCVGLSVHDHIFGMTLPIFSKFLCMSWPWLCSLWRRSDTLCTSGFMDDVIFARKPRSIDVAAQPKRSAHAALGLAINCAQDY